MGFWNGATADENALLAAVSRGDYDEADAPSGAVPHQNFTPAPDRCCGTSKHVTHRRQLTLLRKRPREKRRRYIRCISTSLSGARWR